VFVINGTKKIPKFTMQPQPQIVQAQEDILQKTVGTGARIDYMLEMIRMNLRNSDITAAREWTDKAGSELSKGGDWERKNKLNVYRGVIYLFRRDFKAASDLFIKSLATFCDLLTFRDFVFYTVITSLVSQDRVVIKTKILESPEILSVVSEVPFLYAVVIGLYECRYKEFLENFTSLIDEIKVDGFLNKHLGYITKNLRMIAYKQFMMAYRSITLHSMAQTFGVTMEFLEADVSDFIRAGKLSCKIDKLNQYIETNRLEDRRNPIYSSVVRQGDLLLNRVQNLSRVIDV
jgi:26S proteasome regulatory subunit N7